jgi:hypothetical protein
MAEHGDRVKDAAVVHNASNQRFEINIDGQSRGYHATPMNLAEKIFVLHSIHGQGEVGVLSVNPGRN